jgi:hypothetical protein
MVGELPSNHMRKADRQFAWHCYPAEKGGCQRLHRRGLDAVGAEVAAGFWIGQEIIRVRAATVTVGRPSASSSRVRAACAGCRLALRVTGTRRS